MDLTKLGILFDEQDEKELNLRDVFAQFRYTPSAHNFTRLAYAMLEYQQAWDRSEKEKEAYREANRSA